ncbi:two-component regulator propeller domain-containing protein [Spirosoma sp.]|uniref:type IX secretion system anionic LPS delivery protein PorZ n=1 Tax=Spirosoma sp. TaxID=1899569 RepID=UPI003B3A8540
MTNNRKKNEPKWSCLLLIFHCTFFIIEVSFAQIDTWKSHVSYRSGQSVVVVGNKVYAATRNGFFYYDKATSETVTLDKTSGLSDVGISRLLYLADQKRLLIAYRNGNLDFLTLTETGEPGSIANFNTILSASSLPDSRTINHLNRIGNNAYLSTDFGLLVLDLQRNEIRDTYFSQRPDGTPLPIYQTAATADSLYALTAPQSLTEIGYRLRAVRFAANVNIADPANWRAVQEPNAALSSLLTDQNRLYVSVNNRGVYTRNNASWLLWRQISDPVIRLFPSAEGPVLATSRAITLPNSLTFTGSGLIDPNEVVTDGNAIWVADTQNGLLAGTNGTFQPVAPDGPASDQFGSLYAYAQTLVALPNGPQDNTALIANRPPSESFSVQNQRWSSNLVANVTVGFNSAAYLPAEQKLYLSNFGGGLWSQSEGQTPVAVSIPGTVGPFITSLAADLEGNLWITTGGSNAQLATLHVRRTNGQFQSFPSVYLTGIQQIVPDDNGFLWMRLGNREGIQVFDPQTNRSRLLTSRVGQGALPNSNIRTLAKDRNGAIWVGTDLGPTVFDYPAGIFDSVIDGQPPLINGRRLLGNQVITAVAVDGGNRKWIGTQSGLYHVAPDGSQLLNTFTAENSPLSSNTIQTLAIEPISGNVFIQTPNGLMAYRGGATEPAQELSQLTIFPNPVRPDFMGTVGINGLTENSTVKILDAGGQLVYETRSQGGTATWNLRDYRGRTAQTGIYLVVVVTSAGVEGLAGKLAIVR